MSLRRELSQSCKNTLLLRLLCSSLSVCFVRPARGCYLYRFAYSNTPQFTANN